MGCLGACNINGDLDMLKITFKKYFKFKRVDAGYYVALAMLMPPLGSGTMLRRLGLQRSLVTAGLLVHILWV